MSDDKVQGEFCWSELQTNDVSAAKEFYGSLFGWKSQDMDIGNGMTYTSFKQGDKDIGGMMQIPEAVKNQVPPHWLNYIMVDDLDAMVEKAVSLGANICVPQTDIQDYGRFAVLTDPTGAGIALWQNMKSC